MLKLKSKSGKTIIFRPPQKQDVRPLLHYINALVAEDALIFTNQKQTLKQQIEYVSEAIKKIKIKQSIHLLAFHNNTLIGNCNIEKSKYRSAHVGSFNISIAKSYRTEGIGYQLAKTVIREARKNLGIKLVRLDVFSPNRPALKLYQKLGFKHCGRVPGAVAYQGKFVDRIFMYKSLTTV